MLAEETQVESIALTPAAVEAVRDLLTKRSLAKDEYALRVFVSGGGCSGLQYGMALDSNVREQDTAASFDGIRVIVDEISIQYLQGATVDYVDGVMGSGFKIENPNAVAACGCGSSFRTKNNDGEESAGGCAGCH
jgi:iron-sulfur cluster assembly accessory protein